MPETPAPATTARAGSPAVVVKLFPRKDNPLTGEDKEYLERMGRWHQRRHRRKHRLGYLRR